MVIFKYLNNICIKLENYKDNCWMLPELEQWIGSSNLGYDHWFFSPGIFVEVLFKKNIVSINNSYKT